MPMLIMKPHLLCTYCGEELRFAEGTSVPMPDLMVMNNVHHCRRGTWASDVASAMPNYLVSRLTGHPRLYVSENSQQERPSDSLAQQIPFGD